MTWLIASKMLSFVLKDDVVLVAAVNSVVLQSCSAELNSYDLLFGNCMHG